MTEIYYNEPQYDKVTFNRTGFIRKHVKELELNFMGEDGEWFNFTAILDDGTEVFSYSMKGSI